VDGIDVSVQIVGVDVDAMAPFTPSPMPRNARIDGTDHALRLCAPLATAAQERALFVYLDPEWRILGLRELTGGSIDAVPLSLRAIAHDALTLGASALLMAHNHPSGDPRPSIADHAATRRLAGLLMALDIRLVEHLVLAQGGWTSFRREGWL